MAKKKTIRTIPQERTPMREQDAQVRARNFEEVACGYSLEEALRESERCLMCPDEPCISGCPVGINIPGFIQKIEEKNFRAAYDILTATNLLPSVCGRVCPQENQCDGGVERPGTACPAGQRLRDCGEFHDRFPQKVGDESMDRRGALKFLITFERVDKRVRFCRAGV